MNYLNESGEFHEVASKYSGKFSHGPSQPARIQSPRSMLSCDKCLQPETWSPSGLQENVFFFLQIHARRSSHYKYLIEEFIPFMTTNAAGESPALISTGKPVARDEERIGSTIPMPTVASRPSTMNSFMTVDIPQSSVVGQQRHSRYRNFNFDKYPYSTITFTLEDEIQKPGDYLF